MAQSHGLIEDRSDTDILVAEGARKPQQGRFGRQRHRSRLALGMAGMHDANIQAVGEGNRHD